MQAVVGLGNPGVRYTDTRHNLGFRVVDLLASRLDGDWAETPAYAFSEIGSDPEALVLVKPMTYMNHSGVAVADLLQRFNVALEDMLVVVDDVHLEPGRIRLRRKGSHGGHNGMVSIIDAVGFSDFPRLRLGIGLPQDGIDLIDHVLGVFDSQELERVEQMARMAADGVMCWTTLGLDVAMNRYNAL